MAYSAIDAYATLCEDLDTGPGPEEEGETESNERVVQTFLNRQAAARAMLAALEAVVRVADRKTVEFDAAHAAIAQAKAAGITTD